MKMLLVSTLFLTLALNVMASEIVGLKSNNPPLTGELAGVKECQLAEVSEDSVVFKSFYFKEKANGNGLDVYAVATTEQHRIKAFIQPTFTQPKVSVVNPPNKNLFDLTFEGEKNKDKSSVLDLSLKLCLSKVREKELVDINLFLQQQLLVAKEIVDQTPTMIRDAHQMGYLKGFSQNIMASFILGKAEGQLEGLVVGYEKGAADGLGVGFKLGVVTTLEAIGSMNSGSDASAQGFQRVSTSRLTSDEGAFTPAMKKAVYRPVDSVNSHAAERNK